MICDWIDWSLPFLPFIILFALCVLERRGRF
jgi:hypothetical protein